MVPVSPLIFGKGIVSLNNVATPPLTSVKKKKKKKKTLQQPPHTNSQQSKANWHVDLKAQFPSQTYSCASEILCNISYAGPLSRVGWIPVSPCETLSSCDKNTVWIYLILTQTHCWNTTMGYSAVELSPGATFTPDQYHSLCLFTA